MNGFKDCNFPVRASCQPRGQTRGPHRGPAAVEHKLPWPHNHIGTKAFRTSCLPAR